MSDDKGKVSIVLLNWNGHKDTIECLKSLKKLDYPNYEIYLVDNNSRADDVKQLKDYLDNSDYNVDMITNNMLDNYVKSDNVDIVFIQNSENAGFAGGNNVSLNYLIENRNTDYVLLLNNDTIVETNLLDAMISKLDSNKNIGFVGVKHYYYDNPDKIQTIGGGFIDMKHGEASASYEVLDEYDFITGSCIFMKVDVLCKIGGIPEDYFMYWEDVDWSTKLRREGYHLTVADNTAIYHKEGASIISNKRLYYHTRNRIRYMRRYADKKSYDKFIRYMKLFVIKETMMKILTDKEYVKALTMGLKDALSDK